MESTTRLAPPVQTGQEGKRPFPTHKPETRVATGAATRRRMDGLVCDYEDNKAVAPEQLADADTVKQAVADAAALLFRGGQCQALASGYLSWHCRACVEALASRGDGRPLSLLIGSALAIKPVGIGTECGAIYHLLSELASLSQNPQYSALAQRLQIATFKAIIQLKWWPPDELESLIGKNEVAQSIELNKAYACIHNEYGRTRWELE
jgi:hypothetical protein